MRIQSFGAETLSQTGNPATKFPADPVTGRPSIATVYGNAQRPALRREIHLLRAPRRLEAGAAVIAALLSGFAAGPWMRAAPRYGAIVLAVLLFLLALRRSGERAGRLAERLATAEKANDVQRQMLEAAARRPRDRDELAKRLRDGRF